MRKLILSDVPKMARFFKQTNAKDKILAAYDKGRKDKKADGEMIAADLFFEIFQYFGNDDVENTLYDFFAGVFEVDLDDIRNIELDDFKKRFSQMVDENNIKSFLELALK